MIVYAGFRHLFLSVTSPWISCIIDIRHCKQFLAETFIGFVLFCILLKQNPPNYDSAWHILWTISINYHYYQLHNTNVIRPRVAQILHNSFIQIKTLSLSASNHIWTVIISSFTKFSRFSKFGGKFIAAFAK